MIVTRDRLEIELKPFVDTINDILKRLDKLEKKVKVCGIRKDKRI